MKAEELGTELLRFISKHKPEFEKMIKGCPPAEIDAYEKISGIPLPAFYRWFLEKMGANWPFSSYISYHTRELIDLYKQTPPPSFKKGFLPVASVHQHWNQSLRFLDLVRGDETDAPLVYYNRDTISSSLWEHLLHISFLSYCVRPSVYTRSGQVKSAQKRMNERLTRKIEEEGFKRVMNTSKYLLLYERGNDFMCLSTKRSYRLMGRYMFDFGSDDPEKIPEIMTRIEAKTSWRFSED